MEEKQSKLGYRRWLSIIFIGLIGQIAWAIENNYINLWVFSQSHDANHITWMTTASAVVATLTTFFMGALSDKLGKRKIFIAAGYAIWGITVFSFGLMSLTNMSSLAQGNATTAILLVGIMNVVVDCVMTFFGSTSNDACFNAFVTDETNPKNRPFVEAVLSIMPLLAMGIMLAVGMILGIPGVQGEMPNAEWAAKIAQPWFIFFLVFGILTTLIGVVSFFLIPKDHIIPNREDGYFKHMVKGFTPKAVKTNPTLYIALLAFMLFNIAIDAFMPYLLVYLQNLPAVANVDGGFYIIVGTVMGIASIGVVLVGLFMEKIGKFKVIFPASGFLIAGSLGLFFVRDSLAICTVFATIMMFGYLAGTAALGAEIRDDTPVNDAGAYQSVRMVFVVMLPMVIGSNLSSLVFQATSIDEFGQQTKVPDANMFLVTAIAAAVSIAPIVWLLLQKKKAARALPVIEEDPNQGK